MTCFKFTAPESWANLTLNPAEATPRYRKCTLVTHIRVRVWGPVFERTGNGRLDPDPKHLGKGFGEEDLPML